MHSYEPYNDITVLIYLTHHLPIDCGTSVWMRKQTALINPVTPKDAKKMKMNFLDLEYRLERERKNREKWIEIDGVGNQFNRMVTNPSGAFHSATRHFGSDMGNGRIYQRFRIGIDWNTFKMNNA